jgi:hypothetical protein
VFEIQILRRMYGAVKTDEGWQIRNNDELEKLMSRIDTVKYTGGQRMGTC